jgi:integrase
VIHSDEHAADCAAESKRSRWQNRRLPQCATFGTGAAQATSIDVVAELLGHASLRSTQIYLHPDAARQRQAIEAGALSKHLQTLGT